MDRIIGRSVRKQVLNNTIDQLDPTIAKYTFSLSAHRKFSRIDQVFDHKGGLKFKKNEIQSVFSGHNGMEEINRRKT